MTDYFRSLAEQFTNPVTAIAQILGFIPLILCWFTFRVKKRSSSLVIKAISDLLSAVHFFMLGQPTGGSICLVNTVRGAIFYQKGKRAWANGIYLPIIFCIATIISSLIGWTGPESLLPMIGSCLAVVGFWQTSPSRLRRFNFVGMFLWLIYGFITLSVMTIVSNLISLTSIAVSEIKELRKK